MDFSVEDHGFCIARNVLSPGECREFLEELGPVSGAGRRGLLRFPRIAAFSLSQTILSLLQPHLARTPVPVRGIYFDKTPSANWAVAWHQDLLLAVRARVDLPGFGPWSVKDGAPHVQPPVALLEQMLIFRLHLDNADESNGALRVLPGSHRLGQLSSEQMDSFSKGSDEIVCEVPAGGAVVMRPLLLHSSARSANSDHRRVIHIEYAGFDLPSGLEWSDEAVGRPRGEPLCSQPGVKYPG
jgi:hypothetical protein